MKFFFKYYIKAQESKKRSSSYTTGPNDKNKSPTTEEYMYNALGKIIQSNIKLFVF